MINIAKILQHNVIGKLLNHGIVFLINILIVRLLGAGNSGLYFNELYLLNFIVFVFSMGLDYAVIHLLSQHPSLFTALKQKLKIVLIVFAAILVLSVKLIPDIWKLYFYQPLLAIVLFSTGNLLLIFFQGFLSALKKFNLQNTILIISNGLFLIYLLLIFSQEDKIADFEHIALAYGTLFLSQGLLMLLFSRQKSGLPKSAVSWKAFIKPGFFIMLSSLLYFVFLRIDNFFVEEYCDSVTLGNYVQCGKIGQYFIYFSSIISSTLLPFIANETVGSSYEEWRKMMKPYLLLISIAAAFVAITGYWLFPFLFGEEFEQMQSIMLVLLPGFVCLGMLTLINSVYIGKGNIKPILIGDAIGLLLVLGFDILLIPAYGVYAAAIISSCSYIIVFLFLLSGFKKQFKITANKTSITVI